MVGFCPGFFEGTNGISDSVTYTAGFKIKKISPHCLFPWFECTNTVLVLGFRWNSITLFVSRLSYYG